MTDSAEIQTTLEELCVADMIDSYCTACANGSKCCAQCSSEEHSLDEFLLTSKTIYTTCSTEQASFSTVNTVKDFDDEEDYEELKNYEWEEQRLGISPTNEEEEEEMESSS